jgi:hypothetical protein
MHALFDVSSCVCVCVCVFTRLKKDRLLHQNMGEHGTTVKL